MRGGAVFATRFDAQGRSFPLALLFPLTGESAEKRALTAPRGIAASSGSWADQPLSLNRCREGRPNKQL